MNATYLSRKSTSSTSSMKDFSHWESNLENTQQEPIPNRICSIHETGFQCAPYNYRGWSKQTNKSTRKERIESSNGLNLHKHQDKLRGQFEKNKSEPWHISAVNMNPANSLINISKAQCTHNKQLNKVSFLDKFQGKRTESDNTSTSRRYPSHNVYNLMTDSNKRASVLEPNIQPKCGSLESEFDFDSVEWSIKIVEHFITLCEKEPKMANNEARLATFFEPPLVNEEFADGFIAEMTMDKDFDSLIFGNSIDDSTQHSFGVSMNIETLSNDSKLQSPDSGFFDEQTVISTDTDFESVPTSPFSSHFSNSPLSESGIEDGDDELDEKSNASLDISRDATDLLMTSESLLSTPVTTSLDINMQPVKTEQQKIVPNVAEAYEELKQLLYTLASKSKTSSSLAGLKTIMLGTSCSTTRTATETMSTLTSTSVPRVLNAPVSAVSCNTSLAIQTSTQDTLVASLDASNLANTSTSLQDSTCNSTPQCAKKPKRGRDVPKLVILDEPEENYRARYESEGCRGPIHGSSENTHPTIKVVNYNGPVWITVYLVTSSGQQHYHSIHGPGSTKVPCKEIVLPGGIPAVQLLVDPDSNMTAILDSLSIKRLRNWEGDKELKKRGIDPKTWKRERKEARLLFQAEIPASDGQPEIKLTCKSRIFQCSSSGPTGNPEIWWTSRTEGSVKGKEEMGLIGKKFPSGCKVRFSVDLPSGAIWESFADVDKNKSHQGAAVILTPPYCDQDILLPVTVNVEIVNGNNVKSGKCSEPIEFTYRPRREIVNSSIVTDGQNITMLGGTITGNQGGTSTTTPQNLTSMANPASLSVSPVVPIAVKQPDETDWHKLCIQIKELQLKGELDSQQIKKLCMFIQRKDLLLLQTFRSANNAGTQEECLQKLKHYLTGLVGSAK